MQVFLSANDSNDKNYTRDRQNIQSMVKDLLEKELPRPLFLRNPLEVKRDEHQHLLTFRDVGQDEYESYVKHTFVTKSSTNKVTVKRQKLKTFTKP